MTKVYFFFIFLLLFNHQGYSIEQGHTNVKKKTIKYEKGVFFRIQANANKSSGKTQKTNHIQKKYKIQANQFGYKNKLANRK